MTRADPIIITGLALCLTSAAILSAVLWGWP